MSTDQVQAMLEHVEALLRGSGYLSEQMYYYDDHRYAEASEDFGRALDELIAARNALRRVVTRMKKQDAAS